MSLRLSIQERSGPRNVLGQELTLFWLLWFLCDSYGENVRSLILLSESEHVTYRIVFLGKESYLFIEGVQ